MGGPAERGNKVEAMPKPKINDLKVRYKALDRQFQLPVGQPSAVRPEILVCFPNEYPGRDSEVTIETDEFTALCPWTGLPDQGKLVIRYVPDRKCIELKSLKYYLLTYRSVGIVQEHAANRILGDLVNACRPRRMAVTLDYHARGGLHTVINVHHP